MTEFPRLLRTGSSAQRAMLEAAQADAPSASSQQGLLLALAIGGAGLSTGSLADAARNVGGSSSPTASSSLSSPTASGIGETAASTAASSLAAPAASALAVQASAISNTLLAKWLVVTILSITAVGVGVVVGAVVARNSQPGHTAVVPSNGLSVRESSPARAQRAEVSSGIPGNVGAAVAAPTLPLPPPNTDLSRSAKQVLSTHSTSSRPSVNRAPSAERLTVGDETALVEKAREALRHGDPAGCLSLLEIRRKGVRGGVLAPEATILRIDALRVLGQRASAAREANRFVHDYPNSPLVERIRDLLDSRAE